jgi:hypothetical protein
MKRADENMLNAMSQYGGSFVRELALLYRLADPRHQDTLRHAFADYFEKYARIAVERSEERNV